MGKRGWVGVGVGVGVGSAPGARGNIVRQRMRQRMRQRVRQRVLVNLRASGSSSAGRLALVVRTVRSRPAGGGRWVFDHAAPPPDAKVPLQVLGLRFGAAKAATQQVLPSEAVLG